MKLNLSLVLCGVILTAAYSTGALASSPRTAKRTPASAVQCQGAAMKAATFIDSLGWGSVKEQPLHVISGTRDPLGSESFGIKSEVSGYVYSVNIFQDSKSEACVILSVDTSVDTGLTSAQKSVDDRCFVDYSHMAGECSQNAGTDDAAFVRCLTPAKAKLVTCCNDGGSANCAANAN